MAEDFNGLDLAEMLQDERRQLSWIIEDMSVLYMENRQILAKIKTLNKELEEFSDDHQENSDDDSQEVIEKIHDVKTEWLGRENELRGTLACQLSLLYQDLSYLHHHQKQPQYHSPDQHHLPRHLWGHLTRKWRPPSSAWPARATKRKHPQKLLRWLERQMPGWI